MPTRREISEAMAVRGLMIILAETLRMTSSAEYKLLRWEMRELQKLWAGWRWL